MDYYRNPKVIGAFLVGTALVSGAYVTKNFGRPSLPPPSVLPATAVEAAPSRVFIPVTDQDTDGLEDWRDQFIQAPAISIQSLDGQDYEAPKTLTRQLGISLMEGLIAAKSGGPVMRSEEQVVAKLTEQIGKTATADKIYELSDITLQTATTEADIRIYGNAIAGILINESVPGLESELILLKNYLEAGEEADPTDLQTLAAVYKNYRDKTLATPVPRRFAKQHLDLVNVYHAMFKNIETMTKTTEDPLLPFVRLKRYEEDVQGLSLALNNLYNAIVPYSKVFEMNDPAILLVNFNNPNL